nr:copper resistance CopC family protein [Streptomyces sp. SID13031]
MFALLVASLLVLVVSTGTAAAHAKLESMTPADGSTAAAPPTEVVLTFSEPVGTAGAEVQVVSPKGTNVSTGRLTSIDNTIRQPVDGLVDVGRYTVDARIVSADGHPITVYGSFTITHAGHPAVPVAATPPTASSSSNLVVIVAMVLVMLVVVALAVVIVRRRPAPR